MATALPASGGTPPDGSGCDAADLYLIHNAFRRLYEVMPAGVRGTALGDRRRVEHVEQNVRLVNSALHHHHHLEDDMIWDTLEARRPACALHVDLMRRHHAEVAELLDATEPLGARWRAAPSEATTEELAVHLEKISTLLHEHLDREEQLVVPVIEEAFSQEEWDQVGAEGQKTYDRSQIFLFFGLIQDSLEPEQLADLLAEVPAMIRLLYALYGRRSYEKKLDLLSAGTVHAGHYTPSAGGSAS